MQKRNFFILLILLILLAILGFFIGRKFIKKENIQDIKIYTDSGIIDQKKEKSLVFKYAGDPALSIGNKENFIFKEYLINASTEVLVNSKQIKSEFEYRKEESEYNQNIKQASSDSLDFLEPPIWYKLSKASLKDINKGDEVKVYYNIGKENKLLAIKILKLDNFSNNQKDSNEANMIIKKEKYIGQISEIDYENRIIKLNIKSTDQNIDPGIPSNDTLLPIKVDDSAKITEKSVKNQNGEKDGQNLKDLISSSSPENQIIKELDFKDLKIGQTIQAEGVKKEGKLVAAEIEKN